VAATTTEIIIGTSVGCPEFVIASCGHFDSLSFVMNRKAAP
jgi:hypothetical protein